MQVQPNEHTLRSWAHLRQWVDTERQLYNWSAAEFLWAYELRITHNKLHWLLGASVPSNRSGTQGRRFRDELTQRRDEFYLILPTVDLTLFPVSLDYRLMEQYVVNSLRYPDLLAYELSGDHCTFRLYTAPIDDWPPAHPHWNERTVRERFPQLTTEVTVIVQ